MLPDAMTTTPRCQSILNIFFVKTLGEKMAHFTQNTAG
jgi:hypothetical protein